jgi:hypothetical protein
MAYTPDEMRNLILKFGNTSYGAPSFGDVRFTFGSRPTYTQTANMGATINVTQTASPYKDYTYTYLKHCPSYIVGYGKYGVQILKGRCVYGGIRDLPAEIVGLPDILTMSNDLRGLMGAHQPEDLPAEITGELFHGEGDLGAYVDVERTRVDFLKGSIRGWNRQVIASLTATIRPIHEASDDFPAEIGTHSPKDLLALLGAHPPSGLSALVRVWAAGSDDLGAAIRPSYERVADLPASIGTHAPGDLGGYLGGHLGGNLGGVLTPFRHGQANLPAALRPWYSKTFDLAAEIAVHSPVDLGASAGGHEAGNLTARIGGGGVGIIEDLPASLVGELYHGVGNIGAQVAMHAPRNLGMSLVGVKSGILNLGGNIRGMIYEDLNAVVGGHQPQDLGIILRSWVMGATRDLSANIRGFASSQKDLGAEVGTHLPVDLGAQIGTHPPRNLGAIIATHLPADLQASIRPWTRGLQEDLPASTHGWQQGNLPATIGAHAAGNLSIFLRSWFLEEQYDLAAEIRGLQGHDLPAQIALHSPRNLGVILRSWDTGQADLGADVHGYMTRDLPASVDIHLPENLRASIRAWHAAYADLGAFIRIWSAENLPASIGIHDPIDLPAIIYVGPPPPLYSSIRGWVRNVQADLPASTYGWQSSDLGAFAGGHPAGNLGIILRAWNYGAIRDLPANIHGWQDLDLSAKVGGDYPRDLGILLRAWKYGDTRDLPAYIHSWQQEDLTAEVITHQPRDLSAYLSVNQYTQEDLTANVFGFAERYLTAEIDTHGPRDLRGSIRAWHEVYRELPAFIHGWQEEFLGAEILIHQPGNLPAIIATRAKVDVLLPASLHGFQEGYLQGIIDIHQPRDLKTYIDVRQHEYADLPAIIYNWHERYLQGIIGGLEIRDLSAHLNAVSGVDLLASIKTWPESYLPAIIYAWFGPDLGASIKPIWARDLSANVVGVAGLRNLTAWIKGYGREVQYDLGAFLRGVIKRDLGAEIRCKYINDLFAYVFPVVPVDLIGNLHGWDTKDLPAILNGADYPYNLTASIVGSGTDVKLWASIDPIRGRSLGNLPASIHPHQLSSIAASVYAIDAPLLSASLTAVGNARDLSAYIRPKIVRMTTLMQVHTMEQSTLTAMINVRCGASGHSNLSASIDNIYIYDLGAYVRAAIAFGQGINLGASIGWAGHTTKKEKLPISIDVRETVYYVRDRLPLFISVAQSYLGLGASITGLMQTLSLGAAISGVRPTPYLFTNIKNTERVFKLDHRKQVESYEDVEIAFRNIVEDYFYSSGGEVVFKKDKQQLWIAELSSFIPPDGVTTVDRKLHKWATIGGLRKFDSVDEAIKHAIEYVTLYPEASLGASISSTGGYTNLSGTVYSRSALTSADSALSCAITGEDLSIVYDDGTDVFVS